MVSLFVFLIFLFQDLSLTSGDEFLVQNFTVEDGLPVNSVNGILQDDDGYLWFSTLDGLVRYDGYDFRVYNSGNTDGMVTNRISGIIKTKSNEIWMIHPDGTITRKTGAKFEGYSEDQEDFEGHADRLLEAKNGDIWIATTKGIFRFNPETDSFLSPNDPLIQSATWAIDSTVGGGILILNKNGLLLWERGEATVLAATHDFPIPAESILQIKQFNVYDVWLMGGGGLFKYSLYSNEIDFSFYTENSQSTVWNLHSDIDGTYIINTSEGFYSWEPITQYVAKLQPEISTTTDRINLVFRGAANEEILLGDDEVFIDGQEVFETNEIQSGFIDREGSLWISTLREGIFQIRKSDFTNITSDDIQGFENIYPIIQDTDGTFWAGSFVNGIYRISENGTDNWNVTNSSISGNLCRYLFEDTNGTIYASMWGEGLWRFTGIDWEKIEPVAELTTPKATIEAMYRTRDDRLFIGTTDQLLVFQNGEYKRFAESSANELQGVRVIRESSDGTIFMGTNGNGISILKGGIQRNYTTRNSDLSSDFIRDIYVQSNDTLWLATENLGLSRFILDDQANLLSIKNISEKDGLIKNSLHRMIETPDGHFWISSNSGIMRISRQNLNRYADGASETLSLLFFDEKDGMVSREANGGVQTAGMLSADHKLWFPNQKGITIIDPANIATENSLPPPQPIIENIVLPDSTITLDYRPDVQIPESKRNVRIKFSAPNFFAPGRIQFKYKLEGVNENWEKGGQNMEAVFTNIPSGTHKFLVRTHRTGNPSEISEASGLITIPPTPFETNWFYLLVAVFGALVIFAGVKYRTRVLEIRERKLQQRVDQQTKELQKAAEQKSRFFSGITHELKTPLSLISGPLEDLLDHPEEVSEAAIQKLQMMNRNNHRLQNLVDQILDVTKLNSDALKLTFKPVNIVDFTKQIIGQFQSNLDQQNIQLHFEADTLTGKIYLDSDAWERIIINLMSNAIRFSPRGSVIDIRITDLENQFRVSVKDEGIGIDEDDALKVFDYLYQAEGAYSAEGTGIGLYLVKGLVDRMKGNIDLISKKGEGSEFILTLQKGFSHFSESDTIIHFQPNNLTARETAASKDLDPPVVNGTVNRGGASILVVEDNDDFREYLQSTLFDKYVVSVASEGEEALEILAETTPDLIISDVMMPGMNGMEFVRSLREKENFQHLPVIFLSAKNQDVDVETGLSTGADIYLTKPIKSSLLLSQIAAVLRRERVLKTNRVTEKKNGESPLVQQVRTIVYRQLANQSLNVDLLADTLFVSRRKLYKDWKETGEKSLNDFIKQVRLDEAKTLLSEQGFSVQEAALAVGYSNANYFSTSFKKEFGLSPSEMMK